MAVDNVGMDVPIKLGASSSNGFRDIRGADLVSNERTLAKPIPIARTRFAKKTKGKDDVGQLLQMGQRQIVIF